MGRQWTLPAPVWRLRLICKIELLGRTAHLSGLGVIYPRGGLWIAVRAEPVNDALLIQGDGKAITSPVGRHAPVAGVRARPWGCRGRTVDRLPVDAARNL